MTEQIAILLVNTGSPQEATPEAVRAYLAEFLNDPHVMDMPGWIRQIILNKFILPKRPAESAKKYQSIWLPEGSPFSVFGERLRAVLENTLQSVWGEQLIVVNGMSYGEPNLTTQLQNLYHNGIKNILVLPLFPQYSTTTTASIVKKVRLSAIPAIIIPPYYNHPAYIQAMADHIRQFWETHGQAEKLLFSFHGIPAKRIRQGDPYLGHCTATVKHLSEVLNLPPDAYALGFQSRFGKGSWLKPDTQEALLTWAQQGFRTVQVFTPGFAVDCLETLHEIDMEINEAFRKISGKDLISIPALNDSPFHGSALTEILSPELKKLLNHVK